MKTNSKVLSTNLSDGGETIAQKIRRSCKVQTARLLPRYTAVSLLPAKDRKSPQQVLRRTPSTSEPSFLKVLRDQLKAFLRTKWLSQLP